MINEALTHWLLLREYIHKTKFEHRTTFLVRGTLSQEPYTLYSYSSNFTSARV